MADLVNEFSWSRSRDHTFQDCRRKYFYHYYGAWGGWDASAPPEIVFEFDYEPSLRPELTVYTDVQDHVTVVDAVLFVAERLHTAATTDGRRGGRP